MHFSLQELDVSFAQMATDYMYNDAWTNAITQAMVARNYLRVGYFNDEF